MIGGDGILEYYNGSLFKLLSTVYPEHEWFSWKFHRLPPGFVLSSTDKEDIINYLSKELNIKEMSDWDNVKLEVL